MSKNKSNWADILEGDSKKRLTNVGYFINSSFLFLCLVIFGFGLIGGIFVKNITNKLIVAAIFFCIARYFSRNKLAHRVVYGGMEKPTLVSFGATLFLLGSLLASQKMDYLFLSFCCFAPGVYCFYCGYKEGPHYGWDNYHREHS
jgi:hypothetical protein